MSSLIASATEGLYFSWDLLRESVAFVQGKENSVGELENPHPIAYPLLWSLVYYAIGLFVVNWSLRLAVVQPVLRAFMTWFHNAPPPKVKVEKMAQSVMESLFYSSSFVVGVAVLYGEPWVFSPQEWYGDGRFLNRRVLCWYYVTYGARYLQGLFSVMLEHRRKDFWEMVVHHIVTLVLIYLSFHFDEMRIGSVMMVVFDPADIFLHIAKVVKYADNNTNQLMVMADLFFVIFASLFIFTRMVVYLYMVAESWGFYFFSLPPDRKPSMMEKSLLFWITVLWLLGFYWSCLIVKIGYNIFVKGMPGEDIRSDDEDEECHESPVAKKKSNALKKTQ